MLLYSNIYSVKKTSILCRPNAQLELVCEGFLLLQKEFLSSAESCKYECRRCKNKLTETGISV